MQEEPKIGAELNPAREVRKIRDELKPKRGVPKTSARAVPKIRTELKRPKDVPKIKFEPKPAQEAQRIRAELKLERESTDWRWRLPDIRIGRNLSEDGYWLARMYRNLREDNRFHPRCTVTRWMELLIIKRTWTKLKWIADSNGVQI
jgi:hypothetical protein